jgi:hypothetical protein
MDWSARIRRYAKLLVAAALLPALGCGAEDSRAPLVAQDPSGTWSGDGTGGLVTSRCTAGSTRVCAIELGTQGGYVSCASGTQICRDGVWDACQADATRHVTSVPAPPPSSAGDDRSRLQAVGGSSTSCIDNPCDPSCRMFPDTPADPITAPRVDTPTGWLSGGSLANSNVPSAFKTKGSLNAQCSSAPGSDSWNEACQFDQHCVNNACTAFATGASGSCVGVDITSPTSCVPAMAGFRALTVCNRGTVSAPAGIKCYRYSGGSPQFPNDDPGLGALVMTTATVLEPGTCETQQLAEALFGQNGIQSVMCNPPETEIQVMAVGPNAPTSDAAVAGSSAWSNPSNGRTSDGLYASATPLNPNGASTGPNFPSADTTFGSDGSWTSGANAYSDSPAGQYATASPVLPASASGSVGPVYGTTYVNPGISSDGSWSTPSAALTANGVYSSVSLANPNTPTVLTALPSWDNGAPSWSNLARGYVADGSCATATLNAAGSSTGYFGNFGFDSLPANAIVDGLSLSVKWKSTVNSTKYTLGAQVVTGAAYTPVGLELLKSAWYTIESTDSLNIPAAALAGLSSSDYDNTRFKVRLRFTRSNGSVAAATASVDYIRVTLTYHLPSTTATMAVGNFGISGVPSGSTVQMAVQVKWKANAVNPNLVLGLQAYKEWGTPFQAALGSELTRTPALANTDYVDTTPTISALPADLADSRFKVLIRATRSAGTVNPDVSAFVDYVQVNLTWSTGGGTVTRSLVLTGFGLDQAIPANATITSVTAAATWKLSTTTSHATLGMQAYSGSTALGTETTDATSPLLDTVKTQVVSSGLARSDLTDANFGVRVRISRDASTATANPDFTAYLDVVKVTVTWTAPSVTHAVSYGNFGFNAVPSSATVTQVKTEVKWKTSASTSHAQLAFQAYYADGVTPLGSEFVDSSPPTSATAATQTLTGLTLAPTDVADGNLVVRVRATRTNGTSGGGNPDFSALLDYVRVTITYENPVVNSVEECNGANNWSATKLVPDPDACQDMSTPQYVPFTTTRVFSATCPLGTQIVWRNFGYTTSTPSGTKVEFRFRSFAASASGACGTLPAVTSGLPAPIATASLTQDPEVCGLAGTGSPCPKNLYSSLGGLPAAGNACLQMDAYGVPANSLSPELLNWTVTYDCPAAE